MFDQDAVSASASDMDAKRRVQVFRIFDKLVVSNLAALIGFDCFRCHVVFKSPLGTVTVSRIKANGNRCYRTLLDGPVHDLRQVDKTNSRRNVGCFQAGTCFALTTCISHGRYR